jgi:hypothetical protein
MLRTCFRHMQILEQAPQRICCRFLCCYVLLCMIVMHACTDRIHAVLAGHSQDRRAGRFRWAWKCHGSVYVICENLNLPLHFLWSFPSEIQLHTKPSMLMLSALGFPMDTCVACLIVLYSQKLKRRCWHCRSRIHLQGSHEQAWIVCMRVSESDSVFVCACMCLHALCERSHLSRNHKLYLQPHRNISLPYHLVVWFCFSYVLTRVQAEMFCVQELLHRYSPLHVHAWQELLHRYSDVRSTQQ